MADRKAERERLRQARVEREQEQARSQRTRLMIGYGVAGVIGLIVVAGIVSLILSSGGGGSEGNAHIDQASGSTNGVNPDTRTGTVPAANTIPSLKVAAKKAGCIVRANLSEEGHTHIPPGSPTPDYKTNPPTSGNHVEPPYQQADGAYSEMPEEIDFVHSLEHGRLEIEYSPDLPEADQLALKGLYETMYGATLLFPNEKLPYAVATATWRDLMGCKTYKGTAALDAIRDFGKIHWGHGREPVEGFPFTGPTPANPAS
jgi:hypothetical protein